MLVRIITDVHDMCIYVACSCACIHAVLEILTITSDSIISAQDCSVNLHWLVIIAIYDVGHLAISDKLLMIKSYYRQIS